MGPKGGHKCKCPDKIIISGLEANCIIGIHEKERLKKQPVFINLTLWTELSKAGYSDNITDTVNYQEIAEQVLNAVGRSSFFLLEKLADMIVRICLDFKGIQAVQIKIDKPGALDFARSVSVEITRSLSNKKEISK